MFWSPFCAASQLSLGCQAIHARSTSGSTAGTIRAALLEMAQSVATGDPAVFCVCVFLLVLVSSSLAASLGRFSQYFCLLLQHHGQPCDCSMGELHHCAASVCKNLSATRPKQVTAVRNCAFAILLLSICWTLAACTDYSCALSWLLL